MSYPNAEFLVEPEWLFAHKDDPDLVIVDCPWEEYSYTRAHIPGALCRPGHAYVKGSGPDGDISLYIPDAEEFKTLMAELGIGENTTVVLYDEWGTIFAARLWWVLRYYGHKKAKLLNGGWQGWLSANLPVSYITPETPQAVPEFIPEAHPERLVTLEQLIDIYDKSEWQVLDARSDDEYYGRDSDGNRRLGHVPGAAHLEWSLLLENSDNVEAVRRFRSADDMQAALDNAGVTGEQRVVTHCQAAVRGAFMAFALELLGYPTPRVYDGSMAEWANLEDTPLEY